MCDYSLHAVKTRPAQVGETVITTTFRGTSTRGFASEREPAVAHSRLVTNQREQVVRMSTCGGWSSAKLVRSRIEVEEV